MSNTIEAKSNGSAGSAPEGVQLAISADVRTGPDGQPWVTVTHSLNFSQFSFAMPAAVAEDYLRNVGEIVRGAVKQTTGLVVPKPQLFVPKAG